MSDILGNAALRHDARPLADQSWAIRSAIARRFVRDVAMAFIVPGLLLCLWSLSSARGWLPYQILPPPTQVWETLRDNAASGDLVTNTLISLRRVLEGFALGTICGLLLGVGLGLSPLFRATIDPTLTFVAQIPPIGWIPLLIIALGVDESMKVTVIAYASAIPVLFNVAQGVRDVPSPLRDLGRGLTFDPWATLTRIVLPSAVPSIFTGLREGLANAWQTMVAVEIFASTEGLGYTVGLGRQLFQLDLVLAMILVLGVVGLALNGGFQLLEGHLLRWQAFRR